MKSTLSFTCSLLTKCDSVRSGLYSNPYLCGEFSSFGTLRKSPIYAVEIKFSRTLPSILRNSKAKMASRHPSTAEDWQRELCSEPRRLHAGGAT
jgi:hypothetical protein